MYFPKKQIMKHITIKDVANRLNVSISSVSRAFNDKYDIKKETKERILQVAEEMGYSPNPIAKNLSQKSTFTIGVVVPEFINEYYSEIIIAIQEVFINKGYQVLIMQSDDNAEQELKNVKTLIQNQVEGLIIAPTIECLNIDYYLEQLNKGYPIVFMGRLDKSVPASKVLFNDRKWSFFVTEHLIRQGYKKIYHFSGYKNCYVTNERIGGFKKALEKHKIPKENYKIIETGLLSQEGADIMEDLIYKNDLPEAIFCANDLVAVGAMQKLKINGYQIPEDIAVIGFTETRLAELTSPVLSSVKQPTYEIGKKTAELLLKHIENEYTNFKTIIFNGVLNIRKSSLKNPQW